MRALVVYESMYGNTHAIADAIADGLRAHGEVRVVPVMDPRDDLVEWADIVVAGGPTHIHGMSRPLTRGIGLRAAAKPDSGAILDPAADGPGIRDWLGWLGQVRHKAAAAFDTRLDGAAMVTGRASGGIANGLRRHGFQLVAGNESFLVDDTNRLVAGELERARTWGEALIVAAAARS